MSTRVTADEVKQIIETDLGQSIIDAHIKGANTLVNEVFGGGESDELKEIERWLTAHLLACGRERQALKEEAGSAKVTYAAVYAAGLLSTSYGQVVLSLDTTGKLAALTQKPIILKAIKA